MKANIKPVEIDRTGIPEHNLNNSWSHLHVWFMNNKPGENMIYKDAANRQIIFVRDEVPNFFTKFMLKKIQVISTHTSKSIKLPVYHIVLENGLELIMRGNFHDWKITVSSPFEIPLPQELLSNCCRTPEKISHHYCEGFDRDWILDSYMNNKKEFTIEIGASLYDLYTFFFLLSVEVNKESLAFENL